jgi:hypothetical protein
VSLFEGFEGYRQPNREQIEHALRESVVVFDTNVLLELYDAPAAARDIAFGHFEYLGSRLWVPHQVLREFWRNRASRILDQRTPPAKPVQSVRSEIFGIINRLRPDRERTDELETIKNSVDQQLKLLQEQIEANLGEPLDVDAIIRDPTRDPVVQRLESILTGQIGAQPQDEEQLIAEGLRRFDRKQPPGYVDGPKKKDQLPERGTGDYLVWEQALRHLNQQSISKSWVLVTSDQKEDWRTLVDQKRLVLGSRPELVAESLARVGQIVIVLSSPEFYDHMVRVNPSVTSGAEDANESLIETVAQREVVGSSEDVASWGRDAYYSLLARLESRGYLPQLRAIKAAAQSPRGYVDRATVYSLAGYDPDRTLRRFSLPATRITLELINEGSLAEDVLRPLTPVYDRPGTARGFQVPTEFVAFEDRGSTPSNLTWIAAAVEVAREDPGKAWSVSELVYEIRERGLRDLTNALTPEDTLARDLRLRQEGIFVRTSDGSWRLAEGEALRD